MSAAAWRMVLALSLVCGATDAARAQPISIRDSAGIEIIENRAPAWDAAAAWRVTEQPLLRIGSLFGGGGQEFSRPTATTRLSDGRIAVLEAQAREVRWFDAAGRHLLSRGGAGAGPGEFRYVEAMIRLGGDTVVVQGGPGVRHVFFGPDGAYVREELADQIRMSQYGPWGNCSPRLLPDRSLLYCNPLVSSSSQAAALNRRREFSRVVRLPWTMDARHPLGLDGGIETFLVQLDGRTYPVLHPLSALTYAVAGGEPMRIAIAMNPEYSIEIWTPDGRLERIIRRIPGRRVASAAERAAANQRVTVPGVDDATRDRVVAALPAIDSLPAVGWLTYGSAGELWILRHGLLDTVATVYDVVDPRGRLLGEIRLPGGFLAQEVGDDYVLGIRLGELDVPFVELYGLDRRR